MTRLGPNEYMALVRELGDRINEACRALSECAARWNSPPSYEDGELGCKET